MMLLAIIARYKSIRKEMLKLININIKHTCFVFKSYLLKNNNIYFLDL